MNLFEDTNPKALKELLIKVHNHTAVPNNYGIQIHDRHRIA